MTYSTVYVEIFIPTLKNFNFVFWSKSDAYSNLIWERGPDLKNLYKISLLAQMRAIIMVLIYDFSMDYFMWLKLKFLTVNFFFFHKSFFLS